MFYYWILEERDSQVKVAATFRWQGSGVCIIKKINQTKTFQTFICRKSEDDSSTLQLDGVPGDEHSISMTATRIQIRLYSCLKLLNGMAIIVRLADLFGNFWQNLCKLQHSFQSSHNVKLIKFYFFYYIVHLASNIHRSLSISDR